MHISKIVEYVKNEIDFSQDFCEDNVFVTLRTEAILRIIENLEQSHKDILEFTKEIEKKDRQIDLMVEIFYKKFKAELLLEYGFESEEQLKQYFERKSEDVKNKR